MRPRLHLDRRADRRSWGERSLRHFGVDRAGHREPVAAGVARGAVPGSTGFHPRSALALRATVLPGRDARIWTRGRARDATRALYRRLRRSGEAAARSLRRGPRRLRLSDLADAIRERG